MLETGITLLFLFSLWVYGHVFLGVVRAKDKDWLAMPAGLCVIGLLGNALYFACGLRVAAVQIILLSLLVPCCAYLVYTGIKARACLQFLGVCALFLVLALPAFIGGEQYYVFRGNEWDHFNYINGTLALCDNPYTTYRTAQLADFLHKDVVIHGISSVVNARPAVSLILAMLLPHGLGNIHLLAFLYVTSLWTLAFPAMCFAWILISGNLNPGRKYMFFLPALAFVVGFWGQYIFDINAWSQISSLSLQIGLVFTYFPLLKKITGQREIDYRESIPDYALPIIFSAGFFLYYVENAAIHFFFLIVATAVWLIAKKELPGLRLVKTLGLIAGIVLVIAAVPHWRGTSGWLINQFVYGTHEAPDWWKYFDRYLLGINGNLLFDIHKTDSFAATLSSLSRNMHFTPYLLFCVVGSVLPNMVLALSGMYFVTPDYSITFVLRYAWMIFTILLAAAVVCCVVWQSIIRFRRNDVLLYVNSIIYAGCFLLLWFLFKGRVWSAGKILLFVSPYLAAVLCISLFDANMKSIHGRRAFSGLAKGLAIFFIASQIAFGMARICSACDPYGIGYNNITYPSIQQRAMKTEYEWKMDGRDYAKCSGVYLDNDKDCFFMEYMKQKLAYRNVPYYFSGPVQSHYGPGSGYKVGYPPPIETDCRAVFAKDADNKWRVRELSFTSAEKR